MKALSIRSPFAEQIMEGKKRIEFRSWKPSQLPITFLIQVSKNRASIYAGKIIGLITVTQVFDYQKNPDLFKLHKYIYNIKMDNPPYQYGWLLSDFKSIKPFPIKGKLGFFDVPNFITSELKSSQE